AAAVDGFGDVGNTMVDRRNRLRGALGQRGGKEGKPLVDRLDRLRRTVGQRARQRAEAAIDGLVERPDPAVERGVEAADAGAERGFELQQALIERSGDLAAVRDQPGVEGVDVILQAVGYLLGPRAHALDDLAAKGFDGAIE